MCLVLEVSRSGYYAWFKRPKSQRQLEDEKLLVEIQKVHKLSGNRYGHRMIAKNLKNKGIKCGKNRVLKLMKKNNIFSIIPKKYKATTNSKHNYPVAANILNRKFVVEKPNQVWVTDITYVPTSEGWLYVAAVMDLFHRKIVGLAMDSNMKQDLTIKALKQAIAHERPPNGLIHHSDRGVQYASKAYQGLLNKHQFTCSMSRKGNCYDNACMESFFGTLKNELIYLNKYRTRLEARLSIFQYIMVYYNRIRLHSSLGYQSPLELEISYRKKAA